jgi:hypothetical protein
MGNRKDHKWFGAVVAITVLIIVAFGYRVRAVDAKGQTREMAPVNPPPTAPAGQRGDPVDGHSDSPADSPAGYPKLAIENNPPVRRWIRAWASDENGLRRVLERAYPDKGMVEKILSQQGIPPDFFYLGIVESGWSPEAESAAGALGIWQFTPGTASDYGLYSGVDGDERGNPRRSTEAAARYLAHLFDRFGSWNLVLAAYNAGENRLAAVMSRAQTRDFWTIARRTLLPEQTVQFVPKFLAAAAIGRHPDRYGVEVPERAPLCDETDSVNRAESRHGASTECLPSDGNSEAREGSNRYSAWH